MLISIYYPFSDERTLYADRDAFIPSRFLRLGEKNLFLRNLGAINQRPLGGFPGWIGENAICDVQDAIRLVRVTHPVECVDPLRLSFKRFFFDGFHSGYFSVGFSISNRDAPVVIRSRRLIALLERLATTEVRSHHRPGNKYTISSLSNLVVDLYASGSTRKLKSLDEQNYEKNVFAERPIVIVSLDMSVMDDIAVAKAVSPSSQFIAEDRPIYARPIQWAGNVLAFIICSKTSMQAAQSRFLRAGLARLYLQVFSLERIIHLLSGSIERFDEEGLNIMAESVNRALRRLQGAEKPRLIAEGPSFNFLVEIFTRVFRPGYVTQLEDIINRLKARPNLARALRDSHLARFERVETVIQFAGSPTEFVMGDKNTINQGTGNVVIGSGSVAGSVAGRDVTINAHVVNEVLAPLQNIIDQAPTEVRSEASEKLEALKKEAAKGNGADDTILAKLLEGFVSLVPAAASAIVGAFGSPILSAVAGPVTKFVLNKIGA